MTTYRVTLNGRPDIVVECDSFRFDADSNAIFTTGSDVVAYVPAASLAHIVREPQKCCGR